MESFVYEPFYEVFKEAIKFAKESHLDLGQYLSSDFIITNIIMFIRLRISAEMMINKEEYIIYFEDEKEFQNF